MQNTQMTEVVRTRGGRLQRLQERTSGKIFLVRFVRAAIFVDTLSLRLTLAQRKSTIRMQNKKSNGNQTEHISSQPTMAEHLFFLVQIHNSQLESFLSH